MQAHPQSNPAARNHATPQLSTPQTLPRTTVDQGRSQPQRRVPLTPSCLSADSASVAGHAGLAHDAGNLLGALELYCNLLSLPGVLGPEHRHYATELSLISERSSELIRRLLALPASISPEQAPSSSGIPSALATNQHREPSACELVHAHTLRHLTPLLKGIAAGIANVSVSCPASLPSLNIAAESIERITINLVRNAAQAIDTAQANPAQRAGMQHGSSDAAPLPRRGEIRIALAIAASRLRLTVEDNGAGMTPDAVAEFLRPSPLPPGAEHGLGHRIVHELASASGGQISIRVRPGRGTVFCIAWPVPHARPSLDLSSTLSRNIAPRGYSTC